MTRLLVHVEGQTEEDFVNQVLAPYLCARGFSKVGARLMGNARQRYQRGGIRAWPEARWDILNHLKEDPASISTTMVDYYGLPQGGPKGWPGRARFRTMQGQLKRRSRRTSANTWGPTSTQSDSSLM